MFGKSIKSEVLKVVNQKIDTAQANYEKECEYIDQQAEVAKDKAFSSSVNSILSRMFDDTAKKVVVTSDQQDN